jgi:molybdopterin-guanine dinucleotide biosynthesis protein A
MAPALESYLAGGGRRVDTWLVQLRLAEADFSDAPDTFINVNEPDDRQRLEATLLSRAGLH